MVSVCLPSDVLLQHLLSYLGFSYLGRGVSLQGCSSKAQLLLLTLEEGYLLTAVPPDLEHGVSPLGPTAPMQPLLLGRGVAPPGQSQGQKPGGPHAQGAAAKRSYPKSEVRGSGREELPHVQGAVAAWAQEGQEELSHIEGQEGLW